MGLPDPGPPQPGRLPHCLQGPYRQPRPVHVLAVAVRGQHGECQDLRVGALVTQPHRGNPSGKTLDATKVSVSLWGRRLSFPLYINVGILASAGVLSVITQGTLSDRHQASACEDAGGQTGPMVPVVVPVDSVATLE